MNAKTEIRKLKKELIELQGNNILKQDLNNQRVGEGTKVLSSVFFIVAGSGSFLLLGVCWEQLAPLLERDLDFRPFILIFAIASLIIGVYQNVSARMGINTLSNKEAERYRRILEIKNRIIDLEE